MQKRAQKTRVSGLLVQVFGRLPVQKSAKKRARKTRVSGLLVQVFGRLPVQKSAKKRARKGGGVLEPGASRFNPPRKE
jgi:hypothetical protein